MGNAIGRIILNGVSKLSKTGSATKAEQAAILHFAESPISHISIPKGSMAASGSGLNETTQAYIDIIKNNRAELQCMSRRYLSNPAATEEQFAEEFMTFLKNKTKMPYTPEVQVFSSETLAGGMDNVNGILYYNTRGMTRLSELPSTLMHETHHFLQQKEIFSIMSIEEFSKLKAQSDVMQLARENPLRYKNPSEMMKDISTQTEYYIKSYKEAGWEEVMECYPKITNPNSPAYKRAQQLLEADLNYSGSGSRYFGNLQEKEAFDISVRTQWEFDHSVLNEITANEKYIANNIYSTLTSETFAELPRAQELVESINVTPHNLIEVIREAASRGISDPDVIIQMIF